MLWRSTLALRSAIQSSQLDRLESLIIETNSELEFARRQRESFKTAIQAAYSNACRIDLYLPIVVMESRIWSTKSMHPTELKWARLIQRGVLHSQAGWIDIVNAQHLDEYLQIQLEYFEKTFKTVRAERWIDSEL